MYGNVRAEVGRDMSVSRRVVAIHQPDFFPWLGYFEKIARADVFVALDSVQFSKTGGTWCNRVRVLVNQRPAWITMPVERGYHGVRAIREMRIAGTTWRGKLLRTLELAYRQAPYFGEVFPMIEEIVSVGAGTVAEFNLEGLRRLTGRLRLDPAKIVESSSLGAPGAATNLLVNIVKGVGGTAYLCGGGAADYQEDEKFSAAGIELIHQDFEHPVYPQRGGTGFTPGLSVIDALMQCGFGGTHALVMRPGPHLAGWPESDETWCAPSGGNDAR
jgi:hypothetical protein